MKGFVFDPDDDNPLQFLDGARSLVFPDNKLFNFTPTPFTLTNYDVVFPDVQKDLIYFFEWNMQRIDSWTFRNYERGFVEITALPEDWTQTTVLATAPTGAEFFNARIKLSRTVAPSHNWAIGLPIAKMVPESKWISAVGTIQLEAALGFVRLMSIFVDNRPGSPTAGKLILLQRQNIGNAPGGYGDKSGTPGGVPASISTAGWSNGSSRDGGEFVAGTTQGWPLYYPGTNVSPHFRQFGPTNVDYGAFPPIVVAPPQTHRKGGSAQPTLVDPTDMGSTWRIQLEGLYGKRT